MAAIRSFDPMRPMFATPSVVRPGAELVALHALASHRLLQGQREVLIRHGGETYRLRHTRNDKLILTK